MIAAADSALTLAVAKVSKLVARMAEMWDHWMVETTVVQSEVSTALQMGDSRAVMSAELWDAQLADCLARQSASMWADKKVAK